MRIIGGKYRGRVLAEFKNIGVRPTSDMARESLFNILQTDIEGANFLDLYCGSGAVGIEALSRGASKVVFNDLSKDSISLLKKNLDKIGASDYKIFNLDALSFIERTEEKFDFIYVDPPYKENLGEISVEKCAKILTDDGIIIYEDEKPFSGKAEGLYLFDRRKYGRIHLTFFKKKLGVCLFAGSFDPITKGHQEIIDGLMEKFDKVILVVGTNPDKKTKFSEEERLNFVKSVYKDCLAVAYSEIEDYSQFLKDNGVKYYARGIRDEKDLIYEEEYKKQNALLYPEIETVYVKGKDYVKISSSYIRELMEGGKEYSEYLSPEVYALIKKGLKK